jgi:hypothetical protein
MAIRKNTKRIDPRYFLNETTLRDITEGWVEDHHNGDRNAAMLTTAQIGALQAAGLDTATDLYRLILAASDQGGVNQEAAAVLEDPAFQNDDRVTSLGY